MIDTPLLAVGMLMLFAFWGGRIANAVKLPRVSGYLLSGILLSPSISGILSWQLVDRDLQIITEIALSIIAYSIGGSLDYHRLKHLGKSIFWITILQAAGAFLVTTAVLIPAFSFIIGLPLDWEHMSETFLPMALVIGAISAATAPGAVLAIISELKARGPFTTTLLGVIALDDAITIILFAVVSTLAHNLLNPGDVDILHLIRMPSLEIGRSIVLGLVCGVALKFMGRVTHRRESVLMVVLGTLFVASGMSIMFHLSPLLVSMVIGSFLVNMDRGHHVLFESIERVEEPIFGLFFAVAGAHLDLSVVHSAGVLAVIILFTRITGKQIGVLAGARISGASRAITRYMGLALFPQAGVTIGLVLAAREIFPAHLAEIIVNGVVGTVVLNEIMSPPLLKYSLHKVKEASV